MRQQQSFHHMGNPPVLNKVPSLNKWGSQAANTEQLRYTHLMRVLPQNINHNWGTINCTRKTHYAYVLENSSTWNLSQSGILIQDADMLFSSMWIFTCLSDAGFHLCWSAQTSDLSQAMWALCCTNVECQFSPLNAGECTHENKADTTLPRTLFTITASHLSQNTCEGKKPAWTLCSLAHFLLVVPDVCNKWLHLSDLMWCHIAKGLQ